MIHLYASIYVVAIHYPSKAGNAIINNFLVEGTLNWFCQIADNLIFYYAYKAATNKVPLWKRILIDAYILLILSVSWLPTYTINSFYIDTNSEDYTRNFISLVNWYTPGEACYMAEFLLLNLSEYYIAYTYLNAGSTRNLLKKFQ